MKTWFGCFLNSVKIELLSCRYGSTSFRLYESIQVGCVPIYIYTNEALLPFSDLINWNKFAIVIQDKNIANIAELVQRANYEEMLAELINVRHMMTYNFTFSYIISYLKSH